jgi:hypothetical protein
MTFIGLGFFEFPADLADLSNRPEPDLAHPTREALRRMFDILRLHWLGMPRRRATANSNNQADHTTRLVGFPHRDCGKTGLFFGNFERGEGRVCRGAPLPPIDQSTNPRKNFQKFGKKKSTKWGNGVFVAGAPRVSLVHYAQWRF